MKKKATEKDVKDAKMVSFWLYCKLKKEAEAEGRPWLDDYWTVHAKRHMAHKPYGRM